MHLFLSQSTALRLTTFSILYVAQGIPIGLFTIALPAWMAAQGASATDVGSVVAITGLPWAFKLISGPFMDRFAFPSMGRRRPWIMAAQACLSLSLLGLLLVGNPVDDLWTLIVVGVFINSFAALQDVAVDGMAIDILPQTERGRANALMAFGQVVGYSGFGALGGLLLTRYGLATTGLVSALIVTAIFLFSTAVRERLGERLLPWTQGAVADADQLVDASFREIFGNLLRVLVLPMSLLLIGVELLSRMSAGIYVSLLPLMAVQDLGYSAEDYGYWFGLTGGVAAVIGIFFGPLIDRFGAHRLLGVALLGSAGFALAFAYVVVGGAGDGLILTLLAGSQIFSQGFFVSMIALFMGICWTRVAATQFAIYMSLANLSRSLGAGVFALWGVQFGSAGMLYLMAGFMVSAAALLFWYNPDGHRTRLAAIEGQAIRQDPA